MKIGIFGGSFNPIHIGHCILANHILQNEGFDEIWFVVSPQNPLKSKDFYSVSNEQRLRMVELAVDGSKRLKPCDIEFSMPIPSYTINTLQLLKAKFPDNDFRIIIGADNWLQFGKWKDGNKIISDFGVVVYPRPGFPIDSSHSTAGVKFVDAPIIGVSSTKIREGIREGKDMAYLVPEKVLNYMIENKLYGSHGQIKQ